MFNDVLDSHLDRMRQGWDYHFNNGPDYTSQRVALRATFRQYQTYPENWIQGRGHIVKGGPNGQAGYAWNPFQPPQVVVQHNAVDVDQYGAGHAAGAIAMQALIEG